MLIGVLYACAKLRSNLLYSTCFVASEANVIKHMLHWPILREKIKQYTLNEYEFGF
jgi:hypothetical protein